MQSATVTTNPQCLHNSLPQPSRLALITIGNSLRGDDGIAARLCDALPESALLDVCRFDLGPYTGFLKDCLYGHKAAIIIDSTQNGTAPGTVTIIDLDAMLEREAIINLNSCHGFSLADELRIAKQYGALPEQLVFFGVEVENVDWTENISTKLQDMLPLLVQDLSHLVIKVAERLKQNA